MGVLGALCWMGGAGKFNGAFCSFGCRLLRFGLKKRLTRIHPINLPLGSCMSQTVCLYFTVCLTCRMLHSYQFRSSSSNFTHMHH